ncbi:MAG: hypothetical protein ACI8Y4_004917 [Candidatus Poriferisodalaceae bacterium]|jgi:hypothetical protein
MLPDWLDVERLEVAGIVMLAILVVLAFLVVRFVTRVLWRMLWVGLIALVAFGVWTERESLSECQATCSCELFGREVVVPDNAVCEPDEQTLTN